MDAAEKSGTSGVLNVASKWMLGPRIWTKSGATDPQKHRPPLKHRRWWHQSMSRSEARAPTSEPNSGAPSPRASGCCRATHRRPPSGCPTEPTPHPSQANSAGDTEGVGHMSEVRRGRRPKFAEIGLTQLSFKRELAPYRHHSAPRSRTIQFATGKAGLGPAGSGPWHSDPPRQSVCAGGADVRSHPSLVGPIPFQVWATPFGNTLRPLRPSVELPRAQAFIFNHAPRVERGSPNLSSHKTSNSSLSGTPSCETPMPPLRNPPPN